MTRLAISQGCEPDSVATDYRWNLHGASPQTPLFILRLPSHMDVMHGIAIFLSALGCSTMQDGNFDSMSTVRSVWLNQRLSQILQAKRPVRSAAYSYYPSTVNLRRCLYSTLLILITSFKLNNLLDIPNNLLNLSLNPPLLKIYSYHLPFLSCNPPMLRRSLIRNNLFIYGQ